MPSFFLEFGVWKNMVTSDIGGPAIVFSGVGSWKNMVASDIGGLAIV
nr:hypothetical protein [Bacteroidota bacterium]